MRFGTRASNQFQAAYTGECNDQYQHSIGSSQYGFLMYTLPRREYTQEKSEYEQTDGLNVRYIVLPLCTRPVDLLVVPMRYDVYYSPHIQDALRAVCVSANSSPVAVDTSGKQQRKKRSILGPSHPRLFYPHSAQTIVNEYLICKKDEY